MRCMHPHWFLCGPQSPFTWNTLQMLTAPTSPWPYWRWQRTKAGTTSSKVMYFPLFSTATWSHKFPVECTIMLTAAAYWQAVHIIAKWACATKYIAYRDNCSLLTLRISPKQWQ